MKHIILLCDGMADHKQPQLENLTPMQKAKKPYMDKLAETAEIGLVKTIPDGMPPGSDIGNLSILGCDPKSNYSGRSPFEAANIGVDLSSDDVAMRCNLVTLSEDATLEDCTMLDYCADDISTKEARLIIETLQENLGNEQLNFYCGTSYRHCLVYKTNTDDFGGLVPPHDILDENIKQHLPKTSFSKNSEKLRELTDKSREILKNHPVNLKRIKDGKRPANAIWLWGEGRKVPLIPFEEKYKIKGAMISAVDLLKGIAVLSGMKNIHVDGATGYIDTNFEGKANAALSALKSGIDFVYIHIEAPDECGHRGEFGNKVRAIEYIDKRVLKLLIEGLKDEDFKILILSDHATPLELRTHTAEPVPFLLYESVNSIYVPSSIEERTRENVHLSLNDDSKFDENIAAKTKIFYNDACILIEKLVNKL